MVGCRTMGLRACRSGDWGVDGTPSPETNRATRPGQEDAWPVAAIRKMILLGTSTRRGRHGRERHLMATSSNGEVDSAAHAIPGRWRTVIATMPVKVTVIDGSRDGAGPMRFLAWRSRSSSNPSTDRPIGEHHPPGSHHAIRASPTIERRTGPTAAKLRPIQNDIHFLTRRPMSRPNGLNRPASGLPDHLGPVLPASVAAGPLPGASRALRGSVRECVALVDLGAGRARLRTSPDPRC